MNRSEGRLAKDVATHAGVFAFLVVLMFAFNSFSHGTQDLYPTFLQKNLQLTPKMVSLIAIVFNIGALLGGILFGSLSERIGRRRAILIAAVLSVPIIPLWAFSKTVPLLALGGFLMQFMVQGAWGVIPAHINELSPDTLRGFFPGFAYQLGVVFAASSAQMEALMAKHLSYSHAMGIFAATVLAAGAVAIAFGPEAHGIRFGRDSN